jgi:outer membrane protein TolC
VRVWLLAVTVKVAAVTAQATALTDAQALLTVHQSRLVASVTLIQALGGGWSTRDLSSVHVALPTPL